MIRSKERGKLALCRCRLDLASACVLVASDLVLLVQFLLKDLLEGLCVDPLCGHCTIIVVAFRKDEVVLESNAFLRLKDLTLAMTATAASAVN